MTFDFFETNDNYSIRLEISNNSSTIRFDFIRNEKHYLHSTTALMARTRVVLVVIVVHGDHNDDAVFIAGVGIPKGGGAILVYDV